MLSAASSVDLAVFDDLFELLFLRGGEILSATRSDSVLAALADSAASDMVEFLAERSGLAEGVVHWSLEAQAPRSRASFKQMIIILQQLRRSL